MTKEISEQRLEDLSEGLGEKIQALIDSGAWDSRADLGEAFLQWSQWRWSRLGLGSVVIVALLVLTASLQRLRLLMGFGYPELPS